MATYFARKSGNINATDVWATTPAGTASNLFPTFTNSDVLVANSFAITLNVNATVAEIRTDTTGGATAGGSFTINDGITLTANIIFGSSGNVNYVGNAPNSATIVGNVTANGGRLNHQGTGTLNITGILGGSGANAPGSYLITGGSGANAPGIYLTSTGILNVTGNVLGGSSSTGYGIWNQGAATINVTGNVTGGSGSQGIYNQSTGTCTINGQSVGGTAFPGAINVSTGTINATRAVGNAYGPGNTAGLSAAVGVANSVLGVVEIQEIEFGAYGQSPVSGTGIRLKKANTNVAVFNYVDSGSAKTLIDATQNAAMPAASNVRSGVSYASGALTGTCAVPAAGSVALGVPVDNTTGTAVLTPAAIRAELATELGRIDAAISSRLAPSGTLATVTNLTNAPASVTPADIWSHATRTLTSASGPTAVQIRQEMDSNSTKLANLDAAVSSRLAAASYTAPPTPPTAVQIRQEIDANSTKLDAAISTRATPANIPASDITAIKAKTDALNTDRLAQVATTNIVGTLLAQANS